MTQFLERKFYTFYMLLGFVPCTQTRGLVETTISAIKVNSDDLAVDYSVEIEPQVLRLIEDLARKLVFEDQTITYRIQSLMHSLESLCLYKPEQIKGMCDRVLDYLLDPQAALAPLLAAAEAKLAKNPGGHLYKLRCLISFLTSDNVDLIIELMPNIYSLAKECEILSFELIHLYYDIERVLSIHELAFNEINTAPARKVRQQHKLCHVVGLLKLVPYIMTSLNINSLEENYLYKYPRGYKDILSIFTPWTNRVNLMPAIMVITAKYSSDRSFYKFSAFLTYLATPLRPHCSLAADSLSVSSLKWLEAKILEVLDWRIFSRNIETADDTILSGSIPRWRLSNQSRNVYT